jgi:hypothetical protein
VKKMKKIALSLMTIAAVAVMAVGATGAYFKDANAGTISGTVGSVAVRTWGGAGADGLDFAFVNLLPGEPQTVTGNFQNTGTSSQDIWLVFNNLTALSALNSLGTYGEVRIDANGVPIFWSNNLNDHPVDQGSVVRMVPQKIKLASSIGPTASGDFSFTFMYAAKLSGSGGGVWNTYPLLKLGSPADANYPNDGNQADYDQHTVITSDGSGTGLPYQIVATQVGQTP